MSERAGVQRIGVEIHGLIVLSIKVEFVGLIEKNGLGASKV